MGGVLRYKLEVYCGVSLSSKLRSQHDTALQMEGVLWYKLEVYCQYFLDKLYGLGVPKQCPNYFGRFRYVSCVCKRSSRVTELSNLTKITLPKLFAN